MKLTDYEIQDDSGNSDIGTIRIIGDQHFRAIVNLRASNGQLNQRPGRDIITPGDLRSCPLAVRFLAAHGNEYAGRFAFGEIAVFILNGIPGGFKKQIMRILIHKRHITKSLNGYEPLGD